jgi:hypothetical protein
MIRNNKKSLFVLPVILATGLLLVTAAGAFEMEACTECHQSGSTESRLTIDPAQFDMSIHADNATCVDCHSMVEDESHMETPGSGAVDCSQCHEQENLHGLGGDQGNRPQCSDCHTRHAIQAVDDPAASVHPTRLTATCGQCHPAQSGYRDYLSGLPAIKIKTHPKGDLSTDYKEDNCIGCHQGRGAHGEADPISEDRCYVCHMTMAGEKALLGFIHPKADAGDQPGVFVVAILYQIVVFAFVVGGVIFFVRKFSGT